MFPLGAPPTVVASSHSEAFGWREYGNAHLDVVFPTGPSRQDYLRHVADLAKNSLDEGFIAFVAGGGRGIPSGDYQVLASRLGVQTLTDVTPVTARTRSIKGDADLEEMKAAVGIAESALRSFAIEAKVGTSERSAAALIEEQLRSRGAPVYLVHVSAGPYLGQSPSERLFREGQLLTVFVEVTNEAGYWVEVGAIFACGKLAPDDRALAEHCVETLERSEAILAPGAVCAAVAKGVDPPGVCSRPTSIRVWPRRRYRRGGARDLVG